MSYSPLIGGFLANPIPRLLPPSYTLFSQHPYLLPAVVTGSTGVIAVITAIIFLSEVIFHSAYSDAQMMIVQTLPASLRRLRAQKDLEKTSHGGVWELLRYAPFQNVLFLYGCKPHPTPVKDAIDAHSEQCHQFHLGGGISSLRIYQNRSRRLAAARESACRRPRLAQLFINRLRRLV